MPDKRNHFLITINDIMRDFTNITNMAAIFVDVRGKALSKQFRFSNFCKFMRSNPTTAKLCYQCDATGGLESSHKLASPYRCHAGLIDFTIPIIQNGGIFGFLAAGQVINNDRKIAHFPIQTNWRGNVVLENYYKELPNYSYEEIHSAINVLHIMISHFFPESNYEHLNLNLMAGSNKNSTVQYRHEIKKVLTYIDKNLTNNITLRDISNYIHLSESYLSRIFKEDTGTSLIQYVNEKKIEQAKIFLKSTAWSIELIAKKMGFNHPSYFIKTFKNITGQTPNAYRQRYKQ